MLTGGQQDVPVDEKNLLYVAITRATQQVFLSPTILKLLRRANEYFLYHDNKDSQVHIHVQYINCVAITNSIITSMLLDCLYKCTVHVSNAHSLLSCALNRPHPLYV